MMLLQRVLNRKLSVLSAPRIVGAGRAMAATTVLTSSSPTQLSEKVVSRNSPINSIADNSSLSSFIACGVVTTAAVIYQGSDCQKLGGTKRSYRNTSYCDSNNDTNHNDNSNGKSNDSDSFFDFAQQWANEVLTPKNSSQSAGENHSNSVPLSSNNRVPDDALLRKLGLTRNKSSEAQNVESPLNEGDVANSTEQNNTSVTQMMKSVMFKLQDEIQSSIPKSSSSNNDRAISDHTELDSNDEKSSDFLSFAENVSSFFSRKSSNPDITEIIQQAQNIANNDNASNTMSSSSGFLSQVLYFQQNAKSIQRTLESSFGSYVSNDVNLSDLFQSIPSFAAVHYYLEHQESIKTPSWKRRRHRFQPAVEVSKVNELNEALILSELSYADSVDEIRAGLKGLYDENVYGDHNKSKEGRDAANSKAQWELLFCDTQSRPNEPSHFLAIQKNASEYDDTLHVLMVVRGTKSMGDLITDAMMEATDYEYEGVKGKAHVGITRSGEYLTKRHKKLLASLLQLSGKRKLDITLIGHSLGAAAATIAAMNMNTDKFAQDIGNELDKSVKVSANVIGFGCPAVLSQNISVMTRSFVTTVIADADVIPRMSGATIVNLLLDLNQFEYQELAERDVEEALRELQGRFSYSSSPVSRNRQGSKQPTLSIDEDAIQKVMGYVHRGIEKISGEEGGTGKSSGKSKIAEEMTPCLFPPGTCIHFYRDGSGIDGTYVPCTFFDEIDVARTMVDDHLISSGYRKIFLNMMRDFHKDDHFKFER